MTADHIADLRHLLCGFSYVKDFSTRQTSVIWTLAWALTALWVMYSNRGNLGKQIKAMMVWVFIYAVVSFLFYFPLKYYNGEKGKLS